MHLEITNDDLDDRRLIKGLRALLDSMEPPAAPAAPAPGVYSPTQTETALTPPPEPVADDNDEGEPDDQAPDVDAHGTVWNADHHASSKAVTADGSWRARRGGPVANASPLVQRETNAAVLAQAASSPEAAVAAAPMPPVPPAPTPTPAPAAPAAPAPAPAAPAGLSGFPALMRKVNAAQTSGRLTAEGLQQLCTNVGVGKPSDLFQRADLQPAFEALLDAI